MPRKSKAKEEAGPLAPVADAIELGLRRAKEREAAGFWTDINDLTPWEDNPRKNDGRPVEAVMDSIKRFGFSSPIIARQEDGQVIAGHTRLKAAKALGLEQVPVRFMDLDPADAKLLALADNKLGELADWDDEVLARIVADVDSAELLLAGFTEEDLSGIVEALDGGLGDAYTTKVEAPIYEIKGDKPSEGELFDATKTLELQQEIQAADLPEEVRVFLATAAQRHTVFRYDRIAEYYAHASPEVQDLMERSALVIIDFDKAIEGGFVQLTSQLAEICKDEHGG